MLTERFRSKHLLAYMQNEVGQHAHARSHIHMHVNINFKQLWCTGTVSLSPLLSLFHNSISLFGFCDMVLKMPDVLLCVWVRKRRRGRIWEWYRAMCMLSISTKYLTLSLENKQHKKKKNSVMLQNYLTLISEVSDSLWFPSHLLWPLFLKCFFYI